MKEKDMMHIIQRNNIMRKSFTVNVNRTKDEIKSYQRLLIDNIYQGVEIFYPYQKTKEVQTIYKNAIKEYLCLDNVEIVLHLPYGVDGNLACDETLSDTFKRLKDAIEFASYFNIKKATLHPGCIVDLNRKETVIKVSKRIKELCQYASKFNIRILLENLVGMSELMLDVCEYQELKSLIDEPNLGITFDVGHFHASNINNKTSDIVNYIKTLKDDIYHIHVSDNDQTKDMHAKIGSGTIDFVTFFKTLKDINYLGLISSEVLFNSVQDLIETSIDIEKNANEVIH